MLKFYNHRFVAVHALVERPDPWTITTNQRYFPYRERDVPDLVPPRVQGLVRRHRILKSLARVSHRRHPLKLLNPVYYELHLSSSTVGKSEELVGDPNCQVAVLCRVRQSRDTPAHLRILAPLSGLIVFLGDEVYYVVSWKDLLRMPRTPQEWRSWRVGDRCRKIHDGHLVYYVNRVPRSDELLILGQGGRSRY